MKDVLLPTLIDHFDILSVGWDKATGGIMRCGFVNDYGTNVVPDFNPQNVPTSIHSFADLVKTQFIFSNSYMISTFARSKEDGLYNCYGNYDPAHPGMYHLAFRTSDIEKTYELLQNTDLKLQYDEAFQGFIGWSGRYVNGASLKGQGVVAGLIIEKPYAGICCFIQDHKTPYLLYNPGQFKHINQANTIKEMILCINDLEEFQEMEEMIPVLNDCLIEPASGEAIRRLRLMDAEAVKQSYGIDLDTTCQGLMGLVFSVPDFESLDYVLQINHIKCHRKNDLRIADLTEETGAFFVFHKSEEGE